MPKPITAMLTVSLGAWMPCPSTCRGTMVIAAPVPATVVTNFRLVMSPIVMPFPFARVSRGACCLGLACQGTAFLPPPLSNFGAQPLILYPQGGRGRRTASGQHRGDIEDGDDQQQEPEAREQRQV